MSADHRAVFEAAVRKALDEHEDYMGKHDPTGNTVLTITEAAADWAQERYAEGMQDGAENERITHFG